MNKVTLIVGLPGSGKTYLANQLLNDNTILYDDLSISDKFNVCMQDIEKGQDVIITDPFLCALGVRNSCIRIILDKNSNAELEWIYFENNPDAALANVARRNDGRKVDNAIRMWTRTYFIPNDVVVREIYKGED